MRPDSTGFYWVFTGLFFTGFCIVTGSSLFLSLLLGCGDGHQLADAEEEEEEEEEEDDDDEEKWMVEFFFICFRQTVVELM